MNSKEPSLQDVDRQGIQARVQPRVQQRKSMPRCSLLRASTPAQDLPPSGADGRTHRRYLDKAQACHVSSGLMQGCRRRELVHGALCSAYATQDVQPHLRGWAAPCSVTHRFETTTSCLETVTVLDSPR